MGELFLGENSVLVPGFRVEHTDIEYEAPEIIFDEEGDFAGTTTLQGSNSYTNWLPAIHLRQGLTSSSNLRLAYTRGLARPNYEQLPPFSLVNVEDQEIERGNPELETTTSHNFDVLADHYFSTVGLISGGFFYKRLSDIIFPRAFDEDFLGETFEVTEPQNGESANLYGFEIAFQNRFSFLPGPLSGLSLFANYTFTDSDAEISGRSEDLTLPGQTDHTANLSLGFERWGFSGRLSVNLQGEQLFEVGDDEATDNYLDDRQQLDLSISQQLTRNFRLFFDALNLTNKPYRVYQGIPSQPIQEEYYRTWYIGGLKIDF
jgi:TonB-dependent receptor